jgi:23S rRNA (pseudouridine1915-N3)-methyltransferase
MRESCDYYLRNLAPWVETSEIELKPFQLPDKSAASKELALKKDEETFVARLDKLLDVRSRLVLLDEGGRSLNTMEWADTAKKYEDESVTNLVIGVGSSMGWSPSLKMKAHLRVSFGNQTLSHELARVVLAEQLYRTWSVVRGHPYHHEG